MHLLSALHLLAALTTVTAASDSFLIMGSCPHRVCASTITKCQVLQEACLCPPPSPAAAATDASNPPESCPCCRRCSRCLGDLFAECCGCLDICDHPVRNASQRTSPAGSPWRPQSEVLHLDLAITGLFEELVKHPDSEWTTVSYPVVGGAESAQPLPPSHGGQKKTESCTVAYAVQCMSRKRCKAHCTEMGASGMRWFHDSCCECVGDSCRDRGGLDESRCQNCTVSASANNSSKDSGGFADIYTHLPLSVLGLVPASLPAAVDYDDDGDGGGAEDEDYAEMGSDGDEEDESFDEFQGYLFNADDGEEEFEEPVVAVSNIPETNNGDINAVVPIVVTDYYDDEDEMTDKTELTVI